MSFSKRLEQARQAFRTGDIESSALALLARIGLHVASALYHQIILKDHLLSRMWFGHKG
ncbi:MAG: hypothetical protein MUP03_04070 [Anaerolineales bacterium]|nr:hypothetical protein [Anaerolineales bacterium]